MATVNKNFKIKNGLVVEGATATVNGEAVLTKSAADTTYIQGLVGGVANSQSVANAIVLRDTNASFAANVITADLVGTVSDISNHDTDALAEGTTNKYFSNTLARDAFSAGTGITLTSGEISVTSGTYDAAGSADTAQTNAQNYADGLASNYDASGSASTAQTNAQNYADEAVANLVNGAPELLDTLNELAAALDDNPNVIADLQEVAAGKQDTLVAGSNIDITGNLISVTGVDLSGSADTAQTNAQNYADGLASNYDASGSASTAQTNAQNYADGLAGNYDASGSASTAQTNAQNYSDGLAGNYDASGSASTAQTNAQNYADGLASNYDASGSASTAQTNAQNYADGLASNYDASGSASTAQTNAQNYADGLASNYDASGSASTAQTNAVTIANAYTDEAVANLVNGAPELLDTLNELAAALDDNPNVIADLQEIAGSKQDALVAGTGIDITGNTISVTTSTYDAYGSADTAQTNAQNYADGLASNYDAAGSADTAQTNAQNYADALTTDDVAEGSTNLYFSNALAVSALEAVTPNFQSVDITWVRREEATWTDANTAGTFTAHTFGTSEGSVKYLVRVFNNGESQVSEVLVTTDSSNNIAVTEYAIIYTSENPLATISADWNAGSSEYRLRITTANNNSEILVAATLVAYND